MIICFTVPGICHVTDVTFIFHFGLFFAPNSSKNQNLRKNEKKKKKKKTIGRYHNFTLVYQKL